MAYKPLNISKNEIRLLNILPQVSSGLISCTLFNVPLDEAPEFIAISYVWGDPLNTKKILVNGQVHEVTVNCWNILDAHFFFSKQCHMTSIWIDAICINQKDLRE